MALGMASGAGAALCWSIGFVTARHGVNVGLSPLVIALHRFVWPGLLLFPLLAAGGLSDLGGLGWRRGILLTLFGGLPQALMSYLGYLFVPLGHGGIIQPASASLGGLLLARLVLREPLPRRRIVGAMGIVIGLCFIGAEALRTIGAHGIVGDLLFAGAGSSFAFFGILVRMWAVPATRAATITSVLSLAGMPMLLFSFDNMLAAGFREKSAASRRSGRACRRRGHLSLHPGGRAARRLAGGRVPDAGLPLHAADRLSGARRRANRVATRRTGGRADRLPADAEGMKTTPPCGSPGIRRYGRARAGYSPSSWRRRHEHSLRRGCRNQARRSAQRLHHRATPMRAASPSTRCA